MTTASDVIADGLCEGHCLTAASPRNQCECRCEGCYHGVLAQTEVEAWTLTLTPVSEIDSTAIHWFGALDVTGKCHAAAQNRTGRIYTACDRRGLRYRQIAPLHEGDRVAVDWATAANLWDGPMCRKCIRMEYLTRYVERNRAS